MTHRIVDFQDEAGLLAADAVRLADIVGRLEADNNLLQQQAHIARVMLSEALEIAHQAIAHIARSQK